MSQRKRARCWAILGIDFRAESSVRKIELLSQGLQDVCIALLHGGNRAAREPEVGSVNEHSEPLVSMQKADLCVAIRWLMTAQASSGSAFDFTPPCTRSMACVVPISAL